MITYRMFTPEDAPVLLALFRDTVRRVNIRDYTPEQIAAWAPDSLDAAAWALRFEGRYVVTAWQDEQPVGFAELEPTGRIDRLFVSADHQGQGIGRGLLERLVVEARRRGLVRLQVEASLTAEAFFARLGFKTRTRQTVLCRGVPLDNVRMERRLD